MQQEVLYGNRALDFTLIARSPERKQPSSHSFCSRLSSKHPSIFSNRAVDANFVETKSDSWLWRCWMIDDWYIQSKRWWFSSTFTYQRLLQCDKQIVQPFSIPDSSPVSLPWHSDQQTGCFPISYILRFINTFHLDILWLLFFNYNQAALSIITASPGSVVAPML